MTVEYTKKKISKKRFKKLVNYYFEEVDELSSMEYISAPSGEWDAYNSDMISQEEVVRTLERVFDILGFEIIEDIEDYEEIK